MKIRKIVSLLLITISLCSCGKDIQMIYEVKSGESLESIAYKFGTSKEKLQQLNNLGNVTVLMEGTRLKID